MQTAHHTFPPAQPNGIAKHATVARLLRTKPKEGQWNPACDTSPFSFYDRHFEPFYHLQLAEGRGWILPHSCGEWETTKKNRPATEQSCEGTELVQIPPHKLPNSVSEAIIPLTPPPPVWKCERLQQPFQS